MLSSFRATTPPVRAELVEASARMVWHFDKLSANGVGWWADCFKTVQAKYVFPIILSFSKDGFRMHGHFDKLSPFDRLRLHGHFDKLSANGVWFVSSANKKH